MVLTALNFSNEDYAPTPYLMAFIMALGSLIWLRMVRRYEIISRLISLGGFAILSYTLLGLNNVIQYTTPLWVVINVLFTYFTIGRSWGTTILGLHLVVFSIFFYQKFQSNLEGLPTYSDQDIHFFVIEYAIAFALIAYFLHMFVTTTYHAERKFKVSNSRLNNKNSLISKQNEEKEVMLKEIHHRVKNNLQVITSLLRLQSYEIEDEENTSKFNEAISRVKAMALIHEKMYQRDMLENFDMESYIRSLSTDLIETYSIHKHVEFRIESSVEQIGSKTIVPLALLFNELITNSLKHAFTNEETPLITIVLMDLSDRYFELIYKDNGTWKESEESSFGQELITTMTDQLDGTLKLRKGPQGTEYLFELKNISERFDESSN
jgi:two-component sensor histidine kinase